MLVYVYVWVLSVFLLTISYAGTIQPDDRPTLPKLHTFQLQDKKTDLVTRIATDYSLFGTFLLNDEDGTIVETIKQSKHFDSIAITTEMFRRWLYENKNPTWGLLVQVLREARLNSIANDIELMYGVDTGVPPPTTSGPLTKETVTSDGNHPIKHLKELNKALSDIGNWESLCVNIGVDDGTLSELRNSPITVDNKRIRCLQAYIDYGEATWEDVIKAISEPPIRKRRLAVDIARKHGIDYDELMRDEL